MTSTTPMRVPILTALCLVLLVSCRENPPDPGSGESSASSSWPATRTSDGGTFTVTLAPTEGEILQNKHFSLDLSVRAQNGAPPPIKVSVDADMPAHRHGMNTKPELVEKGEQRFQVDGMLFHMSGDWVITVEVTGERVTERALFPVLVERLEQQ